jgi:hypothetical protein
VDFPSKSFSATLKLMADDGDKLAAILAKRKAARAAKSTTDEVGSGSPTPVPNSRQNSSCGAPAAPPSQTWRISTRQPFVENA